MSINKHKIVTIGKLQNKITKILDIDLPNGDISMYPGFKKHVKKRHPDCVKYIANVQDIINNPDYIGVHPKEEHSVELVKIYDKNILLSINLSTKTDTEYLYVSSLYDISQAKLNNRINSGRLKKFI
ncbi:MAG: hypothetical protein N4A57_15445 [Anaeromicrobium sp.]|jgi:hypothetical protein|uniref:PBECR3 domain-containing polyvalent protein n=1 Tax=Anaeromicrobium sp. TaxID=1929132 RepID=UPI0025CC255E|nr:PBECR2 nuclease fold domain-containing protein [Anaeromicrobium sp.]MCT4595642.1 hypothetical protein [Anaeromicrobium sp.]